MARTLLVHLLVVVCMSETLTLDSLSSPSTQSAGRAAQVAATWVNGQSKLLGGHTLDIRDHYDGCEGDKNDDSTVATSLVGIELSSSIGIIGPSCNTPAVNALSSIVHSLRDVPFVTPFSAGKAFSLVPDKSQVLWAMEQLCTHFGWTHIAVLYSGSETKLEDFEDSVFTIDLIKANDLTVGLQKAAKASTRIVLSILDDCTSLVSHPDFKTLSEKGRVFVTWGSCKPPDSLTGSVFAITNPTCRGAACTALNDAWSASSSLASAVSDITSDARIGHHLMWDATVAMAHAAHKAGQVNFGNHAKLSQALTTIDFVGVTGPIKFNSAGIRSVFNWESYIWDGLSSNSMQLLASFNTTLPASYVDDDKVVWGGGSTAVPVDTITSSGAEEEESSMILYVYIALGVVSFVFVPLLGVLLRKSGHCRMKTKKHVMISYAHVDSEFAMKVQQALLAAGFRVWIDTAIIPAEDWRDNIARAIENAEAVVFIMSPKSVSSKYCKEEVYYAVNRDVGIFPIVFQDSWNDLSGGMKLILQRLQWIFFCDDKKTVAFDECQARLVDNLKTYKKNGGASASKAQGHGHKGEGQGTLMSVPDSNKPRLNVEVKPCDVYICYDSTDPDKNIAYAGFASKLAHHLRLSGVSCVLSARREIRDIAFEAEWEQLGAKKRARIAEEGGGKTEEKKSAVVKKEDANSTLPGMPDEPDHSSTPSVPAPKKKGRKRDRKKNEEHDPFLAELTTREKAETFLKRDTNEATGVDTFEVNSLQIDQTMIMVFLLSPDAMQSGEMVDELHYTYECSKRIIVAKAYSGRESGASKKKDKQSMTGSVGIMLQSAETIDFGRVESHMKWGQMKADSFPFDVLLLDLQLAVFKSKKDTIMERDYAVGEENALLNTGGEKASSNANMVRLKKANLI